MYSTRIPRIVFVTVLCLLIVGSASVAVAQPPDELSENTFGEWTNFESNSNEELPENNVNIVERSYEDTYSAELINDNGGYEDFINIPAHDLDISDGQESFYTRFSMNDDGGNGDIYGIGMSSTDSDHMEVRIGSQDNELDIRDDNGQIKVVSHNVDVDTWYNVYITIDEEDFNIYIWEVTESVPSEPQATAPNTLDGNTFTPAVRDYYTSLGNGVYVDEIGSDKVPLTGVSGEVTDSKNEPLRDVNVEAEQGGEVVDSDTTNDVGQYDIALEEGTYNITSSKQGYRSQTETVDVDGSVQQDFQLTQFNQSINLDTKRFIEHGQRADYRVIVTNDTGRHNVTGEATVMSGNTSVVTVDTDALELQATTDISVNDRTPVTAEWSDGEGNVYTTQTNVTVANATVENIDILPTWTKTSASLGDETLQLIIVATMIGAGAALVASSFAGLSAATGVTVLGWFAGMASDGILIVSFLMAIFIGLNLAGNINMQVGQ